MGIRPIETSAEVGAFLLARINAGEADSLVAYKFLTSWIDPEDYKAKSWFDFNIHDGALRLSYTTRERWESRRDRVGGGPAWGATPFTHGAHRVNGRVASVVRGVVGAMPGDGRAYDVLATAAQATMGEPPKVVVLAGDEIRKRYHEDRHCRCVAIGDLANSCMRYAHLNDSRFAIYADVAQLAVVECQTCGGVQARALLWTDAKGERYVDRIYGSPVKSEFLMAWAQKEGRGRIYAGRGNETRVMIRIPVPKARREYTGAPYMDTLFYWCDTCHELRSKPCKPGHDVATLHGTQGVDHRGWFGVCQRCKNGLNRDGMCGYAYICSLCNEGYCAYRTRENPRPECPNGHVACIGCRAAYVRGETCPNGCVECPGCGAMTALRPGRRRAETCVGCGDLLPGAVVVTARPTYGAPEAEVLRLREEERVYPLRSRLNERVVYEWAPNDIDAMLDAAARAIVVDVEPDGGAGEDPF